jgi:hypothetical protein
MCAVCRTVNLRLVLDSAARQVPDSLRRELANVCRACFSGEGVARHGALVAAYRAQFVAELNPEVCPSTRCWFA